MGDRSINSELALTILQIINEKKPETVKQLIVQVKEQLQIPDQEIVEFVLKLQSEGKIDFAKQPQTASPNLVAYLKTERARWFWVTVATAIATVIVMLTVPEDFYPFVYVRYVLGAIFVLWLPGYTFMRALFLAKPLTKEEKGVDTIERVSLSLGMSLALVPIVGLLLNYTPWGIYLTPIVLSLLALTMVFAIVAIIRECQAIDAATIETLKEK